MLRLWLLERLGACGRMCIDSHIGDIWMVDSAIDAV
jgi:hypothetical protein